MRIKKLPNGQEYYKIDQEWVADPFLCSKAIDYGCIPQSDQSFFILNELENEKRKRPMIDVEPFSFERVVIVSDGYTFKKCHDVLSKLSKGTAILCVNGALEKWKLVGESCPYEKRTPIDYYVINNPYKEADSFLPKNHRYFCKCISSVRTNSNFIKKYIENQGNVYFYRPSINSKFKGLNWSCAWTISDYRNPIAAAIDFAIKGSAKQITLFSCDDSYENQLPGMVEIRPSFYAYPQHQHIFNILDGLAFILSKYNINIYDYSKGTKYQNIKNIETEEEFLQLN